MELGIVGLGRMGASLGAALVEAGVAVHGHDRSAAAREAARGRGLSVHDDLAALARCDAVVTSLPSPEAVRDVVATLGTLLRPGARVIETSTCAPGLAHACAAELAEREVSFVDCPVSGKAPELTLLVGGTAGALGDAEPLLRHAAGTVVHLGRTGAGYAVKLLHQYLKYARFLVAAEALTFAEHEGLDLEATLAALRAGTAALPGLASAEEYFEHDADAVARRAPAATIAKDVALTAAMFAEAGFASPSFDALAALFLDPAVRSERPYPEVIDLLPALRFDQESR